MGYFDTLLRYFEFSGRTTRGQYWAFLLGNTIVAIAAVFGDYEMTGRFPDRHNPGLLFAFVAIFHIVPQVTSAVRRLHDIGKSGWWYLLLFVPVVGLLVVVWTLFYGSEPGANAYGDDPHDGVRAEAPAPKATRRSPAGNAAQAMLARMEARKGASRFAP